LFSISARKTALYLAVHRKITPPARKSGLFMAITGTKQTAQATPKGLAPPFCDNDNLPTYFFILPIITLLNSLS
jgi:hypothetical protein